MVSKDSRPDKYFDSGRSCRADESEELGVSKSVEREVEGSEREIEERLQMKRAVIHFSQALLHSLTAISRHIPFFEHSHFEYSSWMHVTFGSSTDNALFSLCAGLFPPALEPGMDRSFVNFDVGRPL